MLFAVIGSSAGKTRDEIMAIYPRHKAFLDQFITRGEVVGVRPFTDPVGGNMAIFRSRAAAEAFAKSDPFFWEGAVREDQIKAWGDNMMNAAKDRLCTLLSLKPKDGTFTLTHCSWQRNVEECVTRTPLVKYKVPISD